MRFQMTAIWEQPGEDRENVIDEAMGEIRMAFEDDFEDGAFTNLRVDAIPLPRERGNEQQGIMARIGEPRPAGSPRHGFLRDHGKIVHPWDQGLWIFGEDHPLRDVERAAKAGDPVAQETLDVTVEAISKIDPQMRALPPGKED